MSPLYGLFICFIFGLVIGSFLNVVSYRLPIMLEKNYRSYCIQLLNVSGELDDSVIQPHTRFNLALPRSHCTHCKTTIPWWHNIPVLSFLILKGSCHHCHKKISWQYPLVELLFGGCMAWSWSLFGLEPAFILTSVFLAITILLIFIDYHHQLLPDGLTLSLMWIGLLFSTHGGFCSPTEAIFGACLGYGILWSVMNSYYLLTKKIGLGHGDMKYLAALGAWFGIQAVAQILLIASILGASIGCVYMAVCKKSWETHIPFGPFLGIAGIVMLYLTSTTLTA